jgi:DNA-binding sugar fermentation-stimulating protein
MRNVVNSRWTMLVVANVLFCCVLSFYRSSTAAPAAAPFANAVTQRGEMIKHLKELNSLLKEQNALLRSGKLKVVVADQ